VSRISIAGDDPLQRVPCSPKPPLEPPGAIVRRGLRDVDAGRKRPFSAV
jgi:hypothetical protein